VADEDQHSGVPPTVIKPKRTPRNYTGSSRFVAVVVMSAIVGTSVVFYSLRSTQQASTPAAVSTASTPTQASAPPVPDPTDSPTPKARTSTSVSTTVRVFTPAPVRQYTPPPPPQPPHAPPTISPEAQYAQEEVSRTLASRRASSSVKFSQDDQARADLAAAGAPNVVAQVPQYAPTAPPTPMFASDGASAADKFLVEHKTVVGYIRPVSDDQVDAGTLIQCALEWNIDSSLPEGTVSAIVTSPVYSSRNDEVPVIPQGTKLLTTYNSRSGAGIARLQAVGTRLIFADGHEFALGGSSQAAGLQGEAGFPARVSTGAGKQFGNALLAAVLQAGIGLASKPSANVNVGSVQPPQAQAPSPTFYLRSGSPFTFVVADDLPLKEYRTK
jgi:type IV secretory pathway VirB10-like protein